VPFKGPRSWQPKMPSSLGALHWVRDRCCWWASIEREDRDCRALPDAWHHPQFGYLSGSSHRPASAMAEHLTAIAWPFWPPGGRSGSGTSTTNLVWCVSVHARSSWPALGKPEVDRGRAHRDQQSGLAVGQVELAVAAQDRHLTSSIGASRLPAGARRIAHHVITAPMILGPYVGPEGPDPSPPSASTRHAAPLRSPGASRSTPPARLGPPSSWPGCRGHEPGLSPLLVTIPGGFEIHRRGHDRRGRCRQDPVPHPS
jgi:hypothetical protein